VKVAGECRNQLEYRDEKRRVSKVMNTVHNFNASELCSSKLWEVVSNHQQDPDTTSELQAAIEELAARRHYLQELEELGLFTAHRR
jgi:hypothetical protein